MLTHGAWRCGVWQETQRELAIKWQQSLRAGSRVDVLDCDNRWYEAEVRTEAMSTTAQVRSIAPLLPAGGGRLAAAV